MKAKYSVAALLLFGCLSFVIPFSLQTLQGKNCAFLNIFVVSLMVWVLYLMPEEMALKNVNLGSPFLRALSALCHHFSFLCFSFFSPEVVNLARVIVFFLFPMILVMSFQITEKGSEVLLCLFPTS